VHKENTFYVLPNFCKKQQRPLASQIKTKKSRPKIFSFISETSVFPYPAQKPED
jgi:hypothetical protein